MAPELESVEFDVASACSLLIGHNSIKINMMLTFRHSTNRIGAESSKLFHLGKLNPLSR